MRTDLRVARQHRIDASCIGTRALDLLMKTLLPLLAQLELLDFA
jgi:hypothetical protein